MKNKLLLVLVLVLMLVGAGIWGLKEKLSFAEKVRVDRLSKSKVLVVATDPTYAPMEFVNENNETVGFDIELAQRLAESLGVTLKLNQVAWDDIFSTLQDGGADIILSSVSITPERAKEMSFSNPYFSAGQVVVVQKDDVTIYSPEDLKDKRAAAQVDTTSEIEAKKYAGNVTTYVSELDEILAKINSGVLDALVIDYTAAAELVRSNPGLRIASDPFTTEFYGIALRKDDVELHAAINQILAQLKSQGFLKELEYKWFGR